MKQKSLILVFIFFAFIISAAPDNVPCEVTPVPPDQPLGPFPTPEIYQPIVQRLQNIIQCNNWEVNFEKAISDAHDTSVPEMVNIKDLTDYYNFLNCFVLWVPAEDKTGSFIYRMLCAMYFVLDQKPVKPFQSNIVPWNPQPLTELSQWMVDFANDMGNFLGTPQSLNQDSLDSFYAAPIYNMTDYVIPDGGWLGHSFNDLFARKFILGHRPIDDPTNQSVIVSAADSKFSGNWSISNDSIVTLKGLPWSIKELLKDSMYANEFVDGIFMHAFLAPYDYHRQHAPVSGTVLEAKVIPGQVYLEVSIKKDPNGILRLTPIRDLDAPDSPGYQFCQARGLIVIDSPIGKVAVLPIGMAQVSSVVLSTKSGAKVNKGDEISYFQFGGSDIILVFQKESQVKILAVNGTHYKVGNKIAISNFT